MQNIFPIIFVLDPDGALIIGHVTLHLNMSMLCPCSLMLHDRGSMAHNGQV